MAFRRLISAVQVGAVQGTDIFQEIAGALLQLHVASRDRDVVQEIAIGMAADGQVSSRIA